MCGRFTLKTAPAEWGQLVLPLLDCEPDLSDWQPRFNVAPTQDVLTISAAKPESGRTNMLAYRRWGLVPHWADDLAIGNRMINARSETLDQKSSFKPALAKRRCVVIADGYYEWQKLSSKTKQPTWIRRSDESAFCMAGLWAVNRKATGEPVESCTVITTDANAKLHDIHNRMPAMLTFDQAQAWLDPDFKADEALKFLQPAPEADFDAIPVSSYVSNARNEGEQCIEPIQNDRLFD